MATKKPDYASIIVAALTLDAKIIKETSSISGSRLVVRPFCPERPDLECRYGISTGDPSKRSAAILAGRLVNAIRAGKAFTHPRVVKDIHDYEYITFDIHVFGRHLNSDLKKLGF